MRQLIVQGDVSLVGYNYFYCVSDPMNSDTDGDLDLDNADPDKMNYQLNGYFAQQMSNLQLAAQKYLGNSYKPSSSDKYYGQKDIWLSFYYIRYLNNNYRSNKWNKTSGKDDNFIKFINENKEYLELKNYFNKLDAIYANKEGDIVDIKHLGAVISALSYYPTIDELLPKNISFWELLGAKLILNRSEVNSDLDILATWGGDLQQLMNEAYESSGNEDISIKVYELLGSGKKFDMDDLYADIDGEVIYRNILQMYNGRKSFDEITISEAINECYKYEESERFDDFCNIVSLSSETVIYAEKIDLATEYSLSDDYRIFKYPDKILETDYQNIATKFLKKLDLIFKGEINE